MDWKTLKPGREKSEALMPGRAFDALVAEKVMGWKIIGENEHTKPFHKPSKDYPGKIIDDWDSKGPHKRFVGEGLGEYGKEIIEVYLCGCDKSTGEVPHYSTSIAAAWEVVEKLKKECYAFEVTWFKDGTWECGFHGKGLTTPMDFTAVSASHAICLAALKAVEGK